MNRFESSAAERTAGVWSPANRELTPEAFARDCEALLAGAPNAARVTRH